MGKKIIGRFVPTGALDYRQPFNVLTMEPSHYFAPAWTGEKENGETYHVIERAWKFEPVWTGTGAPPVGVECEYTLTGRTWFKCKVEMYVGSQGVVMSCDVYEGIQYVHNEDYPNLTFRQIRSEPDEALEQMRKVVTNYNKTDVIHAIEQLYDAGYRKQ